MNTVLNYDHPLTPHGIVALTQMIGPTNVETIRCDLDFNAPLAGQLKRLVEIGLAVNPTHIIPPTAAIAASYVTAEIAGRLAKQQMPLGLVVITRQPDHTFAPSQVIALSSIDTTTKETETLSMCGLCQSIHAVRAKVVYTSTPETNECFTKREGKWPELYQPFPEDDRTVRVTCSRFSHIKRATIR